MEEYPDDWEEVPASDGEQEIEASEEIYTKVAASKRDGNGHSAQAEDCMSALAELQARLMSGVAKGIDADAIGKLRRSAGTQKGKGHRDSSNAGWHSGHAGKGRPPSAASVLVKFRAGSKGKSVLAPKGKGGAPGKGTLSRVVISAEEARRARGTPIPRLPKPPKAPPPAAILAKADRWRGAVEAAVRTGSASPAAILVKARAAKVAVGTTPAPSPASILVRAREARTNGAAGMPPAKRMRVAPAQTGNMGGTEQDLFEGLEADLEDEEIEREGLEDEQEDEEALGEDFEDDEPVREGLEDILFPRHEDDFGELEDVVQPPAWQPRSSKEIIETEDISALVRRSDRVAARKEKSPLSFAAALARAAAVKMDELADDDTPRPPPGPPPRKKLLNKR